MTRSSNSIARFNRGDIFDSTKFPEKEIGILSNPNERSGFMVDARPLSMAAGRMVHV